MNGGTTEMKKYFCPYCDEHSELVESEKNDIILKHRILLSYLS